MFSPFVLLSLDWGVTAPPQVSRLSYLVSPRGAKGARDRSDCIIMRGGSVEMFDW